MNKENKIKITKFTDLYAWQEGHKLVMEIYKITKEFPKEEKFCLIDQMRRAAVSITSNIAEGFSRLSYLEKIHFYSIGQGSLTEIQNQLFISMDLNYLSVQIFDNILKQTETVHKLINGLIKGARIIHNS